MATPLGRQNLIADDNACFPHSTCRGDFAEHLTHQNRAVETFGDFRTPASVTSVIHRSLF
jgi:hypothetical protein